MNTPRNRRLSLWLLLIVVALILVPACAPATPQVIEKVVRETVVVQRAAADSSKGQPAPTAAPAVTAVPQPKPADTSGVRYANVERLIIKNAELDMTVEDTTVAVDRVTGIAVEYRGYLVASRSWYTENRKEATVSIGVPVEEFENALRRLRGLAIRVDKETASGEDVTDQYVDLNSRVKNLEATADRIRGFLSAAQTITEALTVNQELSKIEEQIETLKGRVNYLADRSAYSTITVQLHEVIPTPTPTVTPTPTATPTPAAWDPGRTFGSAKGVLGDILQRLGDAAIWAGTVCLPFALPLALIGWFVYRRSRQHRPAKSGDQTPPPPADRND